MCPIPYSTLPEWCENYTIVHAGGVDTIKCVSPRFARQMAAASLIPSSGHWGGSDIVQLCVPSDVVASLGTLELPLRSSY